MSDPVTEASAGPVVQTTSGAVRGLAVDGVEVFRGIPYGASTAGAGRFRPPRPVPGWTGVREATRWGPLCPQLLRRTPEQEARSAWTMGPGPDFSFQSEDCLHLNVFTPCSGDGGRRPTMVLFHAGALSCYTANVPREDGSALARRGDLVVVSVNHRVGVLGYLHLEDLIGAEYAGSGNVGQLDLVLALEWVRDNIAAFGGDPDRVTIFGSSGGGAKTATMLAMPAGEGLFHRAIVESAMPLDVRSRDESSALAEEVLHEAGLSGGTAHEIDAVPVERLVAAQAAVQDRAMARARGGPFRRDGRRGVGRGSLPRGCRLARRLRPAYARRRAVRRPRRGDPRRLRCRAG